MMKNWRGLFGFGCNIARMRWRDADKWLMPKQLIQQFCLQQSGVMRVAASFGQKRAAQFTQSFMLDLPHTFF